MTDPETPVDVLAAALREVDSVGGPGLWGDEDTAIAILAAMPDHTIVRRSELEALRAALARWLPPDVVMAGDFMRRTRRDITLTEYDADCELIGQPEPLK